MNEYIYVMNAAFLGMSFLTFCVYVSLTLTPYIFFRLLKVSFLSLFWLRLSSTSLLLFAFSNNNDMTKSTTFCLLLFLVGISHSFRNLLTPSFRYISRLQLQVTTSSSNNNHDDSTMDDHQRTPFNIGTVIGNEFDEISYNTNLTKSLRFSGNFIPIIYHLT